MMRTVALLWLIGVVLPYGASCARGARPACTRDGDCAAGEACAVVENEGVSYRVCAIPCTLPPGQWTSLVGCPAGMVCWAVEGPVGAVCVPAQHRRGLAR